MRAYTEPHRHYHNQQHIAACLALFDGMRALFLHPAEAEWALWLHDVVYDTHAHDNEEQSAVFAAAILREGGAEPASIDRVGAFILATRHTEIPQDRDARLLVDIDLSILGSAPEVFDAYEHSIRLEYAWVQEELFREKRREILEGFLGREYIYLTDTCRETFEGQARHNIRRSVERLHP